jgi:sulfate adenylyltransferase
LLKCNNDIAQKDGLYLIDFKHFFILDLTPQLELKVFEHARTHLKGAVLLITGLPAAGKTTLGEAVTRRIESQFGRRVSFLDGDEVRRMLSGQLGYSREHRQLNVARHTYIAAEICRHGGIVVCALVAPYTADREHMRASVARHGSFIEIHLATPLAECERRDPKSLYSRARAGALKQMTGIDDPYEAPNNPELRFGGTESTENMVHSVTQYLLERGLLGQN